MIYEKIKSKAFNQLNDLDKRIKSLNYSKICVFWTNL